MSAPTPTPASNINPYAWLLIGPVERPDATQPLAKKLTKEYCNQTGRYMASRVSNSRMDWFRLQYAVNAAFSRGEWGTSEDRLRYMADTVRSTSAVELSLPVAHPLIMRYMGQAASMTISAKATAVTQYAVTRYEQTLNRAVAMAVMGQQGDYVRDATQSVTGFGPDEDQAQADASSSYQDKLVKPINSILTMQEWTNDYEALKNSTANVIANSGLFAMHCVRDGMRLKWEPCDMNEIAFDTNSRRPDMRDMEYAIHCPLMPLPTIAARWPLAKDEVKRLQQASNMITEPGGTGGFPNGNPRPFTVYWREPMWVEQGYVLINGKPTLCTLNEPDPDAPDAGPKYTANDCTEPPKNRYTEGWVGKTKSGFIEQAWHCSFIPWEYTPYAAGTPMSERKYDKNNPECQDVVLSYGPCDIQQTLHDDPFKIGLPMVFNPVEIIDGYIIAPMTVAISPQRVVNQVTTDLVHKLGKSGNNLRWVNENALTAETDEAAIDYASKEGNTVTLDIAGAGGAQNAIGQFDTTLSPGFFNMFKLLPELQGIAQNGTGVSDTAQGRPSTTSQQLVGTTELLLQQSTQMMQPFTQCIVGGWKQVHQYDAMAGKEFYQKFPWALAEMVGDEGMEAIMASDEMALERFRIGIEITVNSSQQKAAADQMILEFLQLGLLDKVSAAQLGGRSYSTDVWEAARVFTQQELRAAQMQQEQEARANQAMMLSEEAARNQERQDKVYDQGFKLMGEKMKNDQKLAQPTAQRLAEQKIPVPSEQTEKVAVSPGT